MWFDTVVDELMAAAEPTLYLHPDLGRPSRLALLPGSFDPLTAAHAAVAEAAAARVDAVVFVLAVRALPKEGRVSEPLLSDRDRVSILDDYCRSRSRFAVGLCSHGLIAEQSCAARVRFPTSQLFLAVGSDKVLQLLDPKWYGDRERSLHELFTEAEVLYAPRAGEESAVEEALERPENAEWRGSFHVLHVPPEVATVSSGLVRELLREGQDVRHLVPPEVGRALDAGKALPPPRLSNP